VRTGWVGRLPACCTPSVAGNTTWRPAVPRGAPICASIDDDPTAEQSKQQVAPYLRGWEAVLGHQRVEVYANSKTIDWALHDGLGSYLWQHDWGPPKGYTHPAAHLRQVEIDARSVDGAGVDVNYVRKPRFGRWD
jgi:Domain of unknown function (DUF1906)